jgi:hypothetical protein
MKPADPEKQLKSFIDKFDPKNQSVIRAVRKALRKRMPTANEIVYDNYNFFVIGYSSTERPSDSIFSIAAAANGVGLCFIHGASARRRQANPFPPAPVRRCFGTTRGRIADDRRHRTSQDSSRRHR